MPTIDLAAGTLNYRAAGPEDSAAPPVVFIHPILTDGQLWQPVADRLASMGIRSYAPDWPLGSHRIPLNQEADRSPAGVAAMVREFLQALDLSNVTLVGNDTGGALTQYVLDSGETRVAKAVLMNCDAFDTFPPLPFKVILDPLKRPAAGKSSMNLMRSRALRHSWLGFGLLSKNLPPKTTASWIEPVCTNADIRYDLAELLKAIKPAELNEVTNRMGAVTVPVTVLWGMKDLAFRPSLGRRLVAAFSDAKWIEVPGARTLLAFDAPDTVAAAIAAR